MHVPKQTAFSGEENAHMCIWQHVTHETCVSSGQTGFQPWEGKVGIGSHAYQEAICNVYPLAKGKSFSPVEWYWVCQPYSGTGLMLRGAGQYKGTPWFPECYGFWGWFFFIISLGVFFFFENTKLGGGEVGMIWEDLGEGKEYDLNILYDKILKIIVKEKF